MKDKIVYGYKMANYLMSRGHTLKCIKPHNKEIGILIFYFKNTNELDMDISEFKQQYSKNNNNSKGDKYDTEVCESSKRLVSRI